MKLDLKKGTLKTDLVVVLFKGNVQNSSLSSYLIIKVVKVVVVIEI